MATRRWLGAAAATFDLWTGTVGGTWSAGDTVTVTINNKSLTGIVGATVTVAQVLSLIKNMFNSLLSSIAADESYAPTGGGQSINEMKEYAAAVPTATTVTFTANVAGRSGTISVSKSSASGTFTIAHTTTATGPNFFSDQDNWSGNTVPVNSDTVVFDAGSSDVTEGLSTGLTGLTIKILDGYTGKIGLPEFNAGGYDEYRTKSLTTAGGTTTVLIDNESLKRCRLAFGAQTAVIVIRNTGTRDDANVPVVLLTGGNSSSTLALTKGDVGAAFYAGDTTQFTTVDMGYVGNQATDARFFGGPDLTLATLNKDGGIAELWASVTTLTHFPQAGVTTVMAGAIATGNIDGGTLILNSTSNVAGTALRVSGDAFMDFDQDPRAKALSNTISLYGPNARIRDRKKVVTSFAVLCGYGVKLNQIDRGDYNTVTFS